MKINFFILLAFTIFITFSSCKKTPKDLSFTMEEMKKMGMPDCNKIWTRGDFEKGFSVLHKIKNSKPFSLPIKGSKKSGEVFDQLISRENMSFVKNDTIPMSLRARGIIQFYGTYEDIADLYKNILLKKQYYTSELIAIYIFGLDVTQDMIDLGQKINKSEDIEDIELQPGFKMIVDLYINLLLNNLDNSKQISKYKADDIELLSDKIYWSLNKNIDLFDDTTKEIIQEKMQTVIDSTSSQTIKEKFDSLDF